VWAVLLNAGDTRGSYERKVLCNVECSGSKVTMPLQRPEVGSEKGLPEVKFGE